VKARIPIAPSIPPAHNRNIRRTGKIRTVTMLKGKRDEIARSIAPYEKKLAQARADLTHANSIMVNFCLIPAADGRLSEKASLRGFAKLRRISPAKNPRGRQHIQVGVDRPLAICRPTAPKKGD
jgi:hypothetical protein